MQSAVLQTQHIPTQGAAAGPSVYPPSILTARTSGHVIPLRNTEKPKQLGVLTSSLI